MKRVSFRLIVEATKVFFLAKPYMKLSEGWEENLLPACHDKFFDMGVMLRPFFNRGKFKTILRWCIPDPTLRESGFSLLYSRLTRRISSEFNRQKAFEDSCYVCRKTEWRAV